MRFSFSDEQEEFRSVVRRFLDDRSPSTEVRRQMETEAGFDREVWDRLSSELGLPGLAVPEAWGGQGFGLAELGIALEEAGRALLCAPLLGSAAFAGQAILCAADDTRKKEWLPGIASGQVIASLALCEPDGRWDADAVTLRAEPEDGRFVLDGTKSYVLDGHSADLIVVVARRPDVTPGAIGFFSVPGDAPGLLRRPLETLDATRKLARLEFSGVAAEPLHDGDGAAALSRFLDRAAIALAHEMIGGAQKVLEMAVDYAKKRVQFGQPIGSFQAIKHKCADMLLEVELARSATWYAAAAADEDDPELPALASLAKSLASDAYRHAAAENIQIHGGVGFTWEYDAHLYFKRAKGSEVLLGDPAWHRERLAQRLGV